MFLGVAVLCEEGLATPVLLAADLVMRTIHDVLARLEFPTRLVATLRQ